MATILLHVYSPEPEEAPRLEPTWAALSGIEPLLPSWRFVHWPTPVDDPQAYERGLRRFWGGSEDLVLLEGDKVPTLEMLQAFERCPEPLCVQACLIYPLKTLLPSPVWAHRRGPAGAWINTGDEWADWAGFPLNRFRAEAMRQNPPDWGPGTWNGLDARVSRCLHERGERWHVHWPACEHNDG